jgi:hypothetical protein
MAEITDLALGNNAGRSAVNDIARRQALYANSDGDFEPLLNLIEAARLLRILPKTLFDPAVPSPHRKRRPPARLISGKIHLRCWWIAGRLAFAAGGLLMIAHSPWTVFAARLRVLQRNWPGSTPFLRASSSTASILDWICFLFSSNCLI